MNNEAVKIEIKIEWSKAPEWAQWFAIDKSGIAAFFQAKPYLATDTWLWIDCTKYDVIEGILYAVENWKESLQKRLE